MEVVVELDVFEKLVEVMVGLGGVNGGEEQGFGKREEDEFEEWSGDEMLGFEVLGDKVVEEQGDDQDSEKLKLVGLDGEWWGVKRQWDEKDEYG